MVLLKLILRILFGNSKEDKPDRLKNIVEFIKREEGFSPTPYRCNANILTIGYGTTEGVTEDMVVTEKEATKLLRNYIEHSLKDIEAIFTSTLLLNHQVDAILSFVYNIGMPRFKSSTLLKCLLDNDIDGVKKQWMRWVYVDRKYNKGLYARRKRELNLFLTGDYDNDR